MQAGAVMLVRVVVEMAGMAVLIRGGTLSGGGARNSSLA